MVSREALKLNEILRNAPKAVDMDLPHQREAGEHAEDMTSEPEGVTYEEAYAVDGLDRRTERPEEPIRTPNPSTPTLAQEYLRAGSGNHATSC
jgi:hypothetical protein